MFSDPQRPETEGPSLLFSDLSGHGIRFPNSRCGPMSHYITTDYSEMASHVTARIDMSWLALRRSHGFWMLAFLNEWNSPVCA
jgi:hypothetical protein